jgi:hypothetical protein
MSDPGATDVAYHLFVSPEQASTVSHTLGMLIDDGAHEPQIRMLARGVLEELSGAPGEERVRSVALTAAQMKIVHTAVKLALDDTQREQSEQRTVLREILSKLPDEHTIRAIQLA